MNAQTTIEPPTSLYRAWEAVSEENRITYDFIMDALFRLEGQAGRLERHGEDVSGTRQFIATVRAHYTPAQEQAA